MLCDQDLALASQECVMHRYLIVLKLSQLAIRR